METNSNFSNKYGARSSPGVGETREEAMGGDLGGRRTRTETRERGGGD